MIRQKLQLVRSHIRNWTAPLPVVWRKPTAKTSPLERQKASTLAFLPDDILLLIIDFLDERSKARMVQTSHYFQNLVEPVLYRYIVLDCSTERRDPLKSHLLQDTLAGRQDLLPCVITYHGPLVPDVMALRRIAKSEAMRKQARWSKFRTTQSTPWKALSYEERFEIAKTIFSGAINMRELHFTDFVDWFSRQLWDPFNAIKSNMNLKKLVLHIGGDSPYLVPILRAQPGLKELELLRGRGSQVPGLQHTDLPELQSLKATLSEAAAIVPGRPVRKLELIIYSSRGEIHQQNIFNEDLLRQLTLSSCDIADLTVRFHRALDGNFVGENLRLVAGYLPRIERLCLSVRGGVSDNLLLGTVFMFSSLQSLKLIGVVLMEESHDAIFEEGWIHRSEYGPQDIGDLFRRLKEVCPSLIGFEWCHREKSLCCME